MTAQAKQLRSGDSKPRAPASQTAVLAPGLGSPSSGSDYHRIHRLITAGIKLHVYCAPCTWRCFSAFLVLARLILPAPLRWGRPYAPPLYLRNLRFSSSPSSLSRERLSLDKGSGNQSPLNPANPLTAYGEAMAISEREKIPRESFAIKQLSLLRVGNFGERGRNGFVVLTSAQSLLEIHFRAGMVPFVTCKIHRSAKQTSTAKSKFRRKGAETGCMGEAFGMKS